MDMMARAWQVLQHEGALALVYRVLGETVYRRLLLFETELAVAPFEPDTRCRWLDVGDAHAYALANPELKADEFRRRLGAGLRCWAMVAADGRLMHALWVASGSAFIDYLDYALPLGTTDAYLFQSYTPAAFRGQRHATVALRALKHALLTEGVRRTVSCVQPDRAIAYPPVFRAGARPVAYVGWIGIGGWRRPFRRPTDRLPWYAPRPRLADATGNGGGT